MSQIRTQNKEEPRIDDDCRAISDIDGPKVAQWFYEELFTSKTIDSDMVAYALDTAIWKLRSSGVSIERWAPFIHMGA